MLVGQPACMGGGVDPEVERLGRQAKSVYSKRTGFFGRNACGVRESCVSRGGRRCGGACGWWWGCGDADAELFACGGVQGCGCRSASNRECPGEGEEEP